MSFLNPPSSLQQVHLFTDASGSWGCAAWHGDTWFQVEWDPHSRSLSIAEKELIPIILACQVWGTSWSGCRVICHCDNQEVVADMRSRSAKHKGMMHLLRCMVFAEARLQCSLVPTYIETKANHLADDLSRNDISSFLFKVPSAKKHPSPVSRYWTFSWINMPTGPPRTSASPSKVFSGRSSAVHPKDIWRCHETLLSVLF